MLLDIPATNKNALAKKLLRSSRRRGRFEASARGRPPRVSRSIAHLKRSTRECPSECLDDLLGAQDRPRVIQSDGYVADKTWAGKRARLTLADCHRTCGKISGAGKFATNP